jgi:hypothetical protein
VFFIVVLEAKQKRERAGLDPMDRCQSPVLLVSVSRQRWPPGGHFELS